MFSELLKIILESDSDFVHTGYVEEKSGCQRVVCNYEEGVVSLDSLEYKAEFIRRYILEGIREKSISPSIWSKLFRAELIKRCYGSLSETVEVKSIVKKEFDMIIIAVNSEKTALEMKMMLIKMGIDEKKIFWQEPGRYF